MIHQHTDIQLRMIDPQHCDKELKFLHLEDTKKIYKCSSRPDKNDDNSEKIAGAYIVYGNEKDGRLQYSEDKYVEGDKYPNMLNHCIGRVMSVNSLPYSQPRDENSLTKEEKEEAKRRENLNEMLASALEQAFDGSYETAEMLVGKAETYYQSISTERARKCSLKTTRNIVMTFSVIAFAIIMLESIGVINVQYGEWFLGMYMGAMGAAISIWQRYGKTEFTGYASKSLYKLEVMARVAVGVIFSIFLIAAVKEKWISSKLIDAGNITAVTTILLGFIAGFSERLVPKIAENMAGNMEKLTGSQISPTANVDKEDTTNKSDEHKLYSSIKNLLTKLTNK